jgi:hypothetical protein
MKNLPINLGYSQMKSINGKIFRTRMDKILITNENSTVKNIGIGKNCNLLEYKNDLYIIGSGKPKTDYVKTDDEFLLLNTLNMCARFTDTTKSFKLILSAPPLTFYESENTFPEYFIGEYEVVHDNKNKKIIIEDVEVYPETFIAYLSNDPAEYENYPLIIIDVGGETTNICYINKGDFKVTDEYFNTSRTGMYHIDTQIANYLKGKYSKYNLEITSDTVEEYRNFGFHLNGDFNKDYMDEEKPFIDNIYSKHVTSCISTIDKHNWNLNNCKVIITGGGGKVMYHTFKSLIPHAILGKNPVFDTLNGLKELASE